MSFDPAPVLKLIDENQLSDAFNQLDGISATPSNQIYHRLKQEYISGVYKTDVDYFSRLTTFVRSLATNNPPNIIVAPPSNFPKEETQRAIANGNLERAFGILTDFIRTNPDADVESQLLMLNGRYKTNERNKNMGLIDFQDAGMENNKITAALLTLINRL